MIMLVAFVAAGAGTCSAGEQVSGKGIAVNIFRA